ncbi:hypothetical protein NKH18_39510 [Streptomyces sp. M10(2022)]
MPAVVQLPAGKALTVRTAADVFLDSLGNPNTVRDYGIGVGKGALHLGEARPLAPVADEGIGGDPGPLADGHDRLIARRQVHLREKTLWRMLYETPRVVVADSCTAVSPSGMADIKFLLLKWHASLP